MTKLCWSRRGFLDPSTSHSLSRPQLQLLPQTPQQTRCYELCSTRVSIFDRPAQRRCSTDLLYSWLPIAVNTKPTGQTSSWWTLRMFPQCFQTLTLTSYRCFGQKGLLTSGGSLRGLSGIHVSIPSFFFLLNNRNVNADFSYVPAFFGCKAAFESVRRCELPFS